MLIVTEQWRQYLSASEALAEQRVSHLLNHNPFYCYVAYPWSKLVAEPEALAALKSAIAEKCQGSVLTYTDSKLTTPLLQTMAAVGISDLFYADLAADASIAPQGLKLWPAPAKAVNTVGRSWQLSGIDFERVLSTESPSRLWFCIAQGIIPVLSWQKFTLPGSMTLWKAATVDCSENRTANAGIDDVLAELVNDKYLIAQKRQALKQLRFLYGADYFIYDILRYAANDTHYFSHKLDALKRYTGLLGQEHDPKRRETLLLMIKSELLAHRHVFEKILSLSREQLDLALMLSSLTDIERQSTALFAKQAKLSWLSELANEI